MALPKLKTLQAYRWATLKHRFHAVDDAGAAQDLTGYTAVMQIRDEMNDGALLLDLTEGAGLATDASGHVDVLLSQEQTGNATWEQGWFDLFLIDSSGNRYAFVTGPILISDSVAEF